MEDSNEKNPLFFFAIIDDRLGNLPDRQDERIIYFYSLIDFKDLVVLVGYTLSYVLLLQKFGGTVNCFKTKKQTIFIHSPKLHYYYLLGIRNENKNMDYNVLKYLKTLSDCYLLVNGNLFERDDIKEQLEIFYNSIFTTFSFNKVFDYLYQTDFAQVNPLNFLKLKSKMNLLRDKYNSFKSCFVLKSNSILFSEFDHSEYLSYLHMARLYAPLATSLPSIKLNKWLYTKKLIPIYSERNAVPDSFIDIYISAKSTIKTVFVLIFKSHEQPPVDFYNDLNIQEVQTSIEQAKSCVVLSSLLKSSLYLCFDGIFLMTNAIYKKYDETFETILSQIEFIRKNNYMQTLWIVDNTVVTVLKIGLNSIVLTKFYLLPERTMSWIESTFDEISINTFV